MAAAARNPLRNPGLSRHPAGERDDVPCHYPGLLSGASGGQRKSAAQRHKKSALGGIGCPPEAPYGCCLPALTRFEV